ncbi:hypothetical protein J6590_079317 [Homalodisca vitripennis]|nr:hypothetical protein J6590_079317 [Homalodisca vitripennis]
MRDICRRVIDAIRGRGFYFQEIEPNLGYSQLMDIPQWKSLYAITSTNSLRFVGSLKDASASLKRLDWVRSVTLVAKEGSE